MILVFRVHRSGILSSMQTQGGWNDLVGQFTTEKKAFNQIKAEMADTEYALIQHWQLVNTNKDPEIRYFTKKGEWVPHFPNEKKYGKSYTSTK